MLNLGGLSKHNKLHTRDISSLFNMKEQISGASRCKSYYNGENYLVKYMHICYFQDPLDESNNDV